MWLGNAGGAGGGQAAPEANGYVRRHRPQSGLLLDPAPPTDAPACAPHGPGGGVPRPRPPTKGGGVWALIQGRGQGGCPGGGGGGGGRAQGQGGQVGRTGKRANRRRLGGARARRRGAAPATRLAPSATWDHA